MRRFVVSLAGVAVAAATALTGPAAAAAPSDLDDFSTNPAYAAIYGQQIDWSVEHCPGPGFPARSAKASRLRAMIADATPAMASLLTTVLREVEAAPASPVECARVDAPKNWLDPSQGTLKVGILRPVARPGTPTPSRLLLSNPGGPGGSGLFFGQQAAEILTTHATHLAVGIDPRGVGLSSNATCAIGDIPPAAGGSDVDAAIAAGVTWQAQRIKNCLAEKDTLLPYIDTVNTARDFNLVRHLLGFAQADYYGVSYGSWLGAVIGKMFPSKFDRLVLDSNTDWASGTFTTVFGKHFVRGFQTSLERVVYPYLARHHDVYGLGRTGAEVKTTIDDLTAKAPQYGAKGDKALRSAMFGSVFGARHPNEFLPDAGASWQELKKVVETATPQPPMPQPAPSLPSPTIRTNFTQAAVICNDSGSTGSLANEIARVQQAYRSYPLIGGGGHLFTCVDWPHPPTLTRDVLDRPLRNVLMLQDENDAPTPYHGAFMTRTQEGHGVRMLLVDDGHGHGAYAYTCASNAGHAYLSEGTFPARDVHCQAGPLPKEKAVYEFGHPASQAQPLPMVMLHRTGEVVDPDVDEDATAALPVQPRRSPAAQAAARRVALLDVANWILAGEGRG